jgi:predicted transcriptional regulator
VTLKEVQDILEAEVLVGRDQLQKPVRTAFAADLMSDVLAFAKPDSLLLTGLTNPQVVRTADILDITAIILVRGKKPSEETVKLAEELKIPILSTRYILFETSGRLHAKGSQGVSRRSAVRCRDAESRNSRNLRRGGRKLSERGNVSGQIRAS